MIGITNYRVRLNKFTIFILTYGLTSLSTYAATSNDIANGIAAYNKGWYSIALKYLTAAEPEYPNDALLRYYRANTFVHLTKMPEAMVEYTKASELDPNGTTGNYAREALQAAGVQPTTAPSIFQANVSATQQTLFEQANERSTYLLQHGQARSTSRLQYGQDRAAQIRQAEDAGAAAMASAGSYFDDGAGGSVFFPAFGPDDIAAYRAAKEFKANTTESMSQRAATAINSRASQRADATRESATALAQQLANPQSGGPILSPVGTNLYVRNYILTPNTENISNDLVAIPPPIAGMSTTANKLAPSSQ